MGSGDHIKVMLSAKPFEKSITNDTQLLFDIVLGAFFWMECRKWHGPGFAQLLNKHFIPVRIAAAKSIVYVRYPECESMLFTEPREQHEQRDTVGTT